MLLRLIKAICVVNLSRIINRAYPSIFIGYVMWLPDVAKVKTMSLETKANQLDQVCTTYVNAIYICTFISFLSTLMIW